MIFDSAPVSAPDEAHEDTWQATFDVVPTHISTPGGMQNGSCVEPPSSSSSIQVLSEDCHDGSLCQKILADLCTPVSPTGLANPEHKHEPQNWQSSAQLQRDTMNAWKFCHCLTKAFRALFVSVPVLSARPIDSNKLYFQQMDDAP